MRLRDVNGNGRLDWVLKLAGAYPNSTTLASQDRVVEYGIVIDTDGDLDADCELGINNDAPDPSGFRVWLKNTNTGVTDEQIGGPYGGLFDFVHPGERGMTESEMIFWFLRSAPSTLCAPFSPSVNVYAWAVAFEDGQVRAVDYAPDAAWLRMP